MKKLLIAFSALLLCFTLFSFSSSENYGVTLVPTGHTYRVASQNSISKADKTTFANLAKSIGGVDVSSTQDFELSMAGKRFIGRIKILSNFEEYIWEGETAAKLTQQESEMVALLSKYAK
jgi:hypothetical protein